MLQLSAGIPLSPLFSTRKKAVQSLDLLSAISGCRFDIQRSFFKYTSNLRPLVNYHVIGSIYSTNECYRRQARGAYKLIQDYLRFISSGYEAIRNSVAKRPLCIMLCSDPGSGKSFFVKQLRETLHLYDNQKIAAPSLFNLSELDTWTDLCSRMEDEKIIHDQECSADIPFVFFDEVDTHKWVYQKFLAPMNDGCFQNANKRWFCSPAVWLFAASNARTWAAFSNTKCYDSRVKNNNKQPDFISRIDAHIDIPSISGDRWEQVASRLLLTASIFSTFQFSSIPLSVLLFFSFYGIDAPITPRIIENFIIRHGREAVAYELKRNEMNVDSISRNRIANTFKTSDGLCNLLKLKEKSIPLRPLSLLGKGISLLENDRS